MSAPPLTLEEYRAATRHLPRPDRGQIMAFAEYVSQAHSWYKKIPVAPSGVPMLFFIDPYAAMDFVQRPGKGFVAMERVKHGFHYNQLPTAEHRRKFGYLSFTQGGTSMVPDALADIDGLRFSTGGAAVVFDAASRDFRILPREVVRVGVACLSSLVHESTSSWGALASYVTSGFDMCGTQREGTPTWPEESGGQAVLKALRQRMAEMHRMEVEDRDLPHNKKRVRFFVEDPIIAGLLAPERYRQHAGVAAAIERVIDLIVGKT